MNKYDIFDYINWRKDQSFDDLSFNEIDNLVFSNLSYIRFKDIIPSDKAYITVNDAIEAFLKTEITVLDIRDKRDLDFLEAIRNTKRYGNLKLFFHREVYESAEETQFAATLIEIKRNLYYLSYRGTDNFIAGWKEDLNLSFETVAAQKLALLYLEEVAKTFIFAKLIVGGHSKGANLAVYACAHASTKTYKKIVQIYNNDGPGFDFKNIDITPYKHICEKMISFTPGFSFVGQMMQQPMPMTIVESNGTSILQHSMYTWLLTPDHLIRLDDIEAHAKTWKYILTSCLDSLNLEERRKFVDGIYEVILAANAHDIFEILPGLIKNRKQVQEILKNMDPATSEAIESAFSQIFDAFKDSISFSLESFGTSLYSKIFGHERRLK